MKSANLRPTGTLGRKLAAAVLLLCVDCPRAEAHLVTTGLGPVYDGAAHLALSPADLAVVLALTLLAADRPLPLAVVGTVTSAIGALHGFLTGSALARAPSVGLELTGTLVAVTVVVTLLAGLVVSLRAFWALVAVRVLGSWIAATGLLMIGWSLRSGR